MVRGAALARYRLNAAKSLRSLNIRVQLSGVEMIESRQYRHICVSGAIDLVSTSSSS